MELTILQCLDKRLRINEPAARCVHEHGTVLHHCNSLRVNQVICSILAHDERCMKRNEVRLSEQLLFGNIREEAFFFERFVRVSIPPENCHSIAFADMCHALADAPRADDSGDLVVKIESQKSAQRKIIILYFEICLVNAAVCSLNKCHRMLCNSIR